MQFPFFNYKFSLSFAFEFIKGDFVADFS